MARTYEDVKTTAADLNELYDITPSELGRMLNRHGSSQRQFAEHVGVTPSWMNRLITQRSSLKRKLQESAAEYFGGIAQFIALKTLVRGEVRPEVASVVPVVKRRRRK